MRIHKFTGQTLAEAVGKVRAELGLDAVILHTRQYRTGGFLGLRQRPMVEVTAAVDTDPNRRRPAAPAEPVAYAAEPLAQLQGEVAAMRAALERLAAPEPFVPPYLGFYEQLVAAGVEEPIARQVIGELAAEPSKEPEELRERLVCRVAAALRGPQPIQLLPGRPRAVIVLVGPTGVGKTTTIAKLAANYTLLAGQKVGLITADTYRIAAVEQLKTYGEIIGVDVTAVFTPPELKDALDGCRGKDLVLIDTAGRSHRNRMQMSELKSLLQAAAPDEVYLVLSLTTKPNDIAEVIQTYTAAGFTRLVFTKLDETAGCGAMLNAAVRTGKAIAYITAGQNVPDDIEVANPERIARMIVG